MKSILAPVVLLGSVSNAFAAGGRDDGSGIFVWAFLGFCALIVVAQVIPALLVMFGLAKGIAGTRQVAEKEKVTTTTMGSE